MTIKRGDIVECINADNIFGISPYYMSILKVGSIYKVLIVTPVNPQCIGIKDVNTGEISNIQFQVDRFKLISENVAEFSMIDKMMERFQ
jgi:hypothetical protein